MFRTFYQSCIGVVIAEIDLDTEKPSGEAEVTIDYKLNTSPGEYRIELISRDNEYYYLMRNGEYANALVSKKAIQEDDECLFKEFKKIQEFVKKHK